MSPTVQKVGNDVERVCAANCKKPIVVGEYAVKKYRTGRTNEYYHTQCWKGTK